MILKIDRKLLLNKKEINKLIGRINQEGLTLIPTKLYFKKGKVKVEIAVAKGKKFMTKDKLKKQEIGIEKKQGYLSKIINDTFKYWIKFKFKIWIQNLTIYLLLLNLLYQNSKIKIIKISNFYETPSYPNQNYPKFIKCWINN